MTSFAIRTFLMAIMIFVGLKMGATIFRGIKELINIGHLSPETKADILIYSVLLYFLCVHFLQVLL
jgi:hypothetical protein